MILFTLKLSEEERQCQKNCCGYYSHHLDKVFETLGPADIVVEIRAKNCIEVL